MDSQNVLSVIMVLLYNFVQRLTTKMCSHWLQAVKLTCLTPYLITQKQLSQWMSGMETIAGRTVAVFQNAVPLGIRVQCLVAVSPVAKIHGSGNQGVRNGSVNDNV